MRFRAASLAFAIAGLVAFASPNSAKAAFIQGTLSLTGGDEVNLGTDQIKFVDGAVEALSGDFLTVLGPAAGIAVSLMQQGSFMNYTTLDTNVGPCGVGCIYSAVNGLVSSTFTILAGYSILETGGGSLVIEGQGVVTLSGYDDTIGSFSLTSQGGSSATLSWSSTTRGVPAPALGAGLSGLLAACFALAVLGRRRRKDSFV